MVRFTPGVFAVCEPDPCRPAVELEMNVRPPGYGAGMTPSPWVAPQVQRQDPDRLSDERVALEEWVDYHRATLLMKCTGLTAEQLRARSVPPSSMSLLGLVRHMTDVERGWFGLHAAGGARDYLYIRHS